MKQAGPCVFRPCHAYITPPSAIPLALLRMSASPLLSSTIAPSSNRDNAKNYHIVLPKNPLSTTRGGVAFLVAISAGTYQKDAEPEPHLISVLGTPPQTCQKVLILG